MEGGEECSSSESGWTMYLASPMHDDDDDQDDQVDENIHEDDHGQQEEEEEDDDDEDDGDSMASDASTGPTHSKQSNERGEGTSGGGVVVDDGKLCDEKPSKYSSYSCMKSSGKKVEKKIMYDGKRSTNKDVSQNETSAASLFDHKVISKTK